jgi:hypothetical protein
MLEINFCHVNLLESIYNDSPYKMPHTVCPGMTCWVAGAGKFDTGYILPIAFHQTQLISYLFVYVVYSSWANQATNLADHLAITSSVCMALSVLVLVFYHYFYEHVGNIANIMIHLAMFMMTTPPVAYPGFAQGHKEGAKKSWRSFFIFPCVSLAVTFVFSPHIH